MHSFWGLGGLTPTELGQRVWQQVQEDRITAQAAQLSFYFLFSIFPFLIALTALLGLFLEGGSTIYETVHRYLEKVAPESVLKVITATLEEVRRGANGAKLSLGLLATMWAASKGMAAIIEALNIVYDVPEGRRWWKRRLVSIVLTLGFLLTLMVALLLLIYGPVAIDAIAARFHYGRFFTVGWRIIEWLLAVAFVLFAFNLIYIFAPNVKHRRWHWLMPGTVAGVTLWLAASYALKLYLSYFDRYSVTYGSLGAVVVLLLWLYLTGIALVAGGEINSEITKAMRIKPEVKESQEK